MHIAYIQQRMLLRVSEQTTARGERTDFLKTWRFAPFMEKWAWHYRKIVWGLIAAFYVLSFNGLWRPGPDSALYLSVARSITRGEGYVYLGEAHRVAYPGLPYLLAGLIKVFGEQANFVAATLMLGMALLALWLCHRLFALMVRPGAALIAVVITSVNFALYRLAFDILTDMPFLLGTIMVLLGAALTGIAPAPRLDEEAHTPTPREGRLGWILLPAGLTLCAVMRPTFYLLAACVLAAAIIAILQVRRGKSRARVVGLACLIAAILVVVTAADPRRAATGQDIYEQAISEKIANAVADLSLPVSNAWRIVSPELPTAYFGYSWSPYADPIIVTVLLSMVGWVLWRWPLAMLWIGGTLLLQIIHEPVPRYMVPILPLLALAWWEAAARANTRANGRLGTVIAITAYVVMMPNFVRSIGQVWFEQYRRPFMSYYDDGKFAAISEMAELINQRVPAGDVVITPERTDRVFTYLADRWSVPASQPIPQHLRGRPVWVVFAKQDPQWRAQLEPNVTLGLKEVETFATYRSRGVLVLRRANWVTPAAPPTPSP